MSCSIIAKNEWAPSFAKNIFPLNKFHTQWIFYVFIFSYKISTELCEHYNYVSKLIGETEC